MKTVMFIIPSLNGGGSERVIVNLANMLCRKYNTTLLVLSGKDSAYQIDPAVRILYYPTQYGWLEMRVRKNLPKLHKIWWCRKRKKEIRPDVSVSFLPQANLINAKSKIGEKVIVSERADPFYIGGQYLRDERKAFPLADHVVFQSERIRSQFPEILIKSSVILNPVHVGMKAGFARENRIVTLGRLVPQKNHKLLIEAFRDFHVEHPEYNLDIYGEGILEEGLRRQIADLHLKNSVMLHGFVSGIHTQISTAKMFVLSSDFEGLSNALMEAMAMGIACISTDVAGSTEIIRSGENGILVKTGNRSELAEAMRKIAEDDTLRMSIEKKALETSRNFNLGRIVSQWEALL